MSILCVLKVAEARSFTTNGIQSAISFTIAGSSSEENGAPKASLDVPLDTLKEMNGKMNG